MPSTFNIRVVAALRGFAWLAAGAAILLGVAVLAGWVIGSRTLQTVRPGLAAMSPLTALGFVLAGISLLAWQKRWPSTACGVAAALVGLHGLVLAGHLAVGRDVADRWLEQMGGTSPAALGLTAPATAVGMLLLGASLLSWRAEPRPRAWLLGAFALPGLVLSALALLGYLYRVQDLYAVAFYRRVAVHTATGLFLLFLACMVREPEQGLAAIVASGNPGGVATRRQLVLATILPVLVGLVLVRAIQGGFIAPALAMAMFVAGTMVPLVVRILHDGAMLDRVDMQRLRAVAAEQTLRQTLEDRVAERTRRLGASEARFRTYFNHAPEGMVLLEVTADGRFVVQAANPAFSAIYETGERDLVGLTPDQWLDEASARNAGVRLATCLAAREVCHYVAQRRIGETEKRIDVVMAAIPEPDGSAPRQILCSVRDVTATALQEDQLRQSQKMEAVGQLTGGLAHDFNNLLTGIAGSLELLGTRLAQGRLQESERYIAAAQGATRRAGALTHRLLAFSRRQTLDPRPTDVNRLVGGMEDLIRRTMGPAITVEMVGAGGLWPTLLDPNQLENALLNLAINARDAMPDGGRLTIETANKWLDGPMGRERDLLPGQYISLCVTDTGVGMPPAVIARAFDPFFTTKPMGEGTGLGLSMVYGFVRQSGGHVRIYSEPARGTTVCLYLPRHHAGEEATPAVPDLSGTPRADAGETVLIVDDEPTVRMLVCDVLGDLGYVAVEAADGLEGLRILQSGARIDLLITDVGLPGGMNGRQMADAARRTRPDLKVLFITGYAENAALGTGRLEPGMHVLTKPFAMDGLGRRIRELIVQG